MSETSKPELTMDELGAAIARGERDPAEAVARLRTAVVYPRFLGVDDDGTYVWELADGQWTWADDPDQAVRRVRTFEPERYVGKYGVPTPVEVKR